mmetsp:Transcript_12887/g.31315  ORF Transcript_12887/g.31315 Transcript_12887/m.31315 type:complete len:101 (+) Transcript_12887:224-526(+)
MRARVASQAGRSVSRARDAAPTGLTGSFGSEGWLHACTASYCSKSTRYGSIGRRRTAAFAAVLARATREVTSMSPIWSAHAAGANSVPRCTADHSGHSAQ